MPRFDDYHRTVVGYHGTGLTAALRIVNRIEGFRSSEKNYAREEWAKQLERRNRFPSSLL